MDVRYHSLGGRITHWDDHLQCRITLERTVNVDAHQVAYRRFPALHSSGQVSGELDLRNRKFVCLTGEQNKRIATTTRVSTFVSQKSRSSLQKSLGLFARVCVGFIATMLMGSYLSTTLFMPLNSSFNSKVKPHTAALERGFHAKARKPFNHIRCCIFFFVQRQSDFDFARAIGLRTRTNTGHSCSLFVPSLPVMTYRCEEGCED